MGQGAAKADEGIGHAGTRHTAIVAGVENEVIGAGLDPVQIAFIGIEGADLLPRIMVKPLAAFLLFLS
ncbi:hypothetical protein Pstr01_13570 [Pseudomonas straminea]|nr:hypothetical protein Pstr01_13570 [Pseudomonas straminea]